MSAAPFVAAEKGPRRGDGQPPGGPAELQAGQGAAEAIMGAQGMPAFDPDEIGGSADPLHQGRDALRLEALGLMTAGIVHDLGNMIQILSMAVSSLGRHPEVQEVEGLQPVIAGAVHSLGRARAMVRLIAGFGQLTATHVEELDIALCLATLERPFRWIAADDIQFCLRVNPQCPKVSCNRRNFENALLNLVLNARDAMPNGGTLVIEAATSMDGGPALGVTVTVRDTGEGMTPEVLARAFEPFFTTKPEGRGNGLGLAMVRRFAQEVGGCAIAWSRRGVGTAISLRLPVADRPCG